MTFKISGTSGAYSAALFIEKAWMIVLKCDGCDRPAVEWGLEELSALPPAGTVQQIADRARCAGCGSAEGVLSSRQGRWGDHLNYADARVVRNDETPPAGEAGGVSGVR